MSRRLTRDQRQAYVAAGCFLAGIAATCVLYTAPIAERSMPLFTDPEYSLTEAARNGQITGVAPRDESGAESADQPADEPGEESTLITE